jgi:hypothetical protein
VAARVLWAAVTARPSNAHNFIYSDANLEGVSVKRVVGYLFLALLVLYVGDYLSARFGFPGNRPIFGTVTVSRTYSVMQKNKKSEFYFLPPADQSCVNALFPHFGVQPCWYLNRHKTVEVDM